MEQITLTIDGARVTVENGTTIMEATRKLGFFTLVKIPGF